MTTGRKRWWRAAALTAVGGVAVTGGWFGLVRAKSPAHLDLSAETTDWTRAPVPTPTITEVGREAEPAPPTGPVTPAGATLPPLPSVGVSAVAPAVPVASPVVVPATPALPPSLPGPSPAVEPVSGPRALDPGLTGGDKSVLPAIPSLPAPPSAAEAASASPPAAPSPAAVVPAPPAPALSAPTPVAAPPASPPAPPALPGLPPVPSSAEPPKAPAAPAAVAPPAPLHTPAPLAPTAPVAPIAPPAKPAEPAQPVPPAKPNSDLKPTDPANTLKPTVAPAVPVAPGGRDVPALPVDRSKVPEPSYIAPTDKYVFPAKPVAPDARTTTTTPRDDKMLNMTTTAAFAVLGGALLAGEKAAALPPVPPAAVGPMTPAVPLRAPADDKDVEKLKSDLKAANQKIEELEKQVKRLTELLDGKRNAMNEVVTPGAVDDVRKLKDDIYKLEKELAAVKAQTQTALKPPATNPAVTPEVKPKGTVKVINEYPVEISMVINDKSYRVAPSAVLDVEVPAGEFSYQLLQSGAPATKSKIGDKETVRLRIK